MKLKRNTKIKNTLSDKIADALTVKPRADIEDDQVFGTKPKIVSRVDFASSESDNEVATTSKLFDFHKGAFNLSEISKKYQGQPVSRKNLDDEANLSEYSGSSTVYDDNILTTKLSQYSSESDEEKDSKIDKVLSDSQEQSSEDDDTENGDYSITKLQRKDSGDTEETSEGDEDDGGYDISRIDETFEHMKKQNVSEEVKKGTAVRCQLLLWESLLEMRIHLQRCMNTANQMPMWDTYTDLRNFKDKNEFIDESNVAKDNITNVLDKMLNLQNILLNKYSETKNLSSNNEPNGSKLKEESDEEIPSDTDEEIPCDSDMEDKSNKQNTTQLSNNKKIQGKRKLEDYAKEIESSHKAFKTFRDSTIQKWNERTRLATATNHKNAPTNTILQQISFILSDRDKLVRRTQLKRFESDIVGYKKEHSKVDHVINDEEINPVMRDRKENDEYIPEIFDDSDFYHQLLRELIECKSADISDPVQLSRQWIAIQQMRSKMKRKVDTKATKGRRIKYVVHNKLVNFMAPEPNMKWTEESKNELYSSLFGKMFENSNSA